MEVLILSTLKHHCRVNLKEALDVLKYSNNLLSTNIDFNKLSEINKTLSLSVDSRKCSQESLFIAIFGLQADGHKYLEGVWQKGTTFCIVEHIPTNLLVPENVFVITVKSSRLAWSSLCALAYGNPQDKLTLIGVTGTNGKTSVVWMIRQLLNEHQIPNVAIGTLGIFFPNEQLENPHTTPDPDMLFMVLRHAVDRGIKHVIMEVSSHSLVQKKLANIKFSIAIFTSFSRDHLDFHKDLEDYFCAKLKLFTDHIMSSSAFFISTSLKAWMRRIPKTNPTVIYGFDPPEDYHTTHHICSIKTLTTSLGHSEISLNINREGREISTVAFNTSFFSPHALENVSAAILVFSEMFNKIPDKYKILKIKSVPGRLELITAQNEKNNTPMCIVDYAHSPDALEKTLRLLRSISNRRISVVFGCGGNRDKGKRPIMGKIAAEYSDAVYVTSDNPRLEDPKVIIQDIVEGIPMNLRYKVHVEADRSIAIVTSIKNSSGYDPPGVVLIAGKGHESYQIVGSEKIEFSDQLCVRNALDSFL